MPDIEYDTTRPPTHASRARNAQVGAVKAMNKGEIALARVQAELSIASAILALNETISQQS